MHHGGIAWRWPNAAIAKEDTMTRKEKKNIVDRFLRGRSMHYLAEVLGVKVEVIEDIIRRAM